MSLWILVINYVARCRRDFMLLGNCVVCAISGNVIAKQAVPSFVGTAVSNQCFLEQFRISLCLAKRFEIVCVLTQRVFKTLVFPGLVLKGFSFISRSLMHLSTCVALFEPYILRGILCHNTRRLDWRHSNVSDVFQLKSKLGLMNLSRCRSIEAIQAA